MTCRNGRHTLQPWPPARSAARRTPTRPATARRAAPSCGPMWIDEGTVRSGASSRSSSATSSDSTKTLPSRRPGGCAARPSRTSSRPSSSGRSSDSAAPSEKFVGDAVLAVYGASVRSRGRRGTGLVQRAPDLPTSSTQMNEESRRSRAGGPIGDGDRARRVVDARCRDDAADGDRCSAMW